MSIQQVEGVNDAEGLHDPEAELPGAAPTPPIPPGEPKVTIMIDPDFTHLRVGIWGTNHELTAKGVELFCERYLDGYLRACVTQVEPETG